MESGTSKSLSGKDTSLLRRFIDSFKKAIQSEMEAMRKRLGPFEVSLTDGSALETGEDHSDRFYNFRVLTPNEKLVLNSECSLRTENNENLVTITGIDGDKITLRCSQKIELAANDHKLVIYPWFLYEKLIQVLDSLLDHPDFFISNALMLFGKFPPQFDQKLLRLDHPELNQSQNEAVQLCSDSNLAFVWGPPGTGKTTTLGHIVTELLAQKKRILVTSTTNAAVDQALAKLSDLDAAQTHFKQGKIIRVGQTSEDTFGASLPEVVGRLNKENHARLKLYRNRRGIAGNQIKNCERVVSDLKADNEPQQLDLFGETTSQVIKESDLDSIFQRKRKETILNLPSDKQLDIITLREKRLRQLLDLYLKKITKMDKDLRRQEAAAIQNAEVILSTMTNVYISSLLDGERFDVVVVEEAGMAVLPTLFYCATLSKEKIIIVGDPRQLPPIVQSDAKYVQKAMGRNIFEITVPETGSSDFVVMLDTQYRMHPVIGDLVSYLFYNNALKNSKITGERDQISDKEPYPAAPLVVVDSKNQTTCQVREGSFSRFNERTAECCLSMAKEAVRSGIESVAIITPYVAQARLIDRLLKNYTREAQIIECKTVHRYQGGERDLVILDTVDAPPLSPGILLAGRQPNSSAENLINVAISRARGKLIIVADVGYFKEKSPQSIVHQMLQRAIKQGHLVSMT